MESKIKKICVVTSCRADYGILRPLLFEIKSRPTLKLQTMVLGMHLMEKYGNTYKEIEQDGIKIDVKIYMNLEQDDSENIGKAIGAEICSISEKLFKLNPDVIVVLGDRYEILAVAFIANIFKIPVAHLCGGDSTYGAYDDNFRHAITKLSHLHFVSNSQSANKVIQLGENPKFVFNYGNPGLEELHMFVPIDKEKLQEIIGTDLFDNNYLIVYHPTTLRDELQNTNDVDELIQVLNLLAQKGKVFIIGTNCDNYNNHFTKKLKSFVNENNDTSFYFDTLVRKQFLSLLYYCNMIIGNSSAGVYEAPLLSKISINIGDRQAGRLKPNSVIDCNPCYKEITCAIMQYDHKIIEINQVYNSEDCNSKIVNELEKIDYKKIIHKNSTY